MEHNNTYIIGGLVFFTLGNHTLSAHIQHIERTLDGVLIEGDNVIFNNGEGSVDVLNEATEIKAIAQDFFYSWQ